MALDIEFNSQHFIAASVNILLQTIGELPIETLEDIDNVLEAKIAQDVILEAKMLILAKGWDVNTDTNYVFSPDTDGYINVPVNVLDIRSGTDIVMREWKLYDKSTRSRKFDAPVECDVKWNLDFNTLPHSLRYYITIYAARVFQARQISDTNMYRFTQEDEQKALIAVKQSNGFTGQYNMLSGSHASNFSVL